MPDAGLAKPIKTLAGKVKTASLNFFNKKSPSPLTRLPFFCILSKL
jgi:hypothetical protein